MRESLRPGRRTFVQGAAAATAMAGLGVPAFVRAQSDAIRFGHLTPRTVFLGPLGEYAVMAADLAVQEINATGGVMGRKLEILKEDSVNPQTASTKAERMVERDKVACIIGEISSASALTIAQVAARTRTLFVNTGGNSDALRGSNCNKFMFHVESQNSMYVKTCGRSLQQQGLVKGKKWFSLTADYAFGHDLLKVAKRFMSGNGGQLAADKLIPTDLTDFSAMLIEIRNAKPDLVISNLAGNQITNFLKQYAEFGLNFPIAGFGFDTIRLAVQATALNSDTLQTLTPIALQELDRVMVFNVNESRDGLLAGTLQRLQVHSLPVQRRCCRGNRVGGLLWRFR